MFLCCIFSVTLGTNWPGSRGPLRDWKPGPCGWHQLYSHLSFRDSPMDTQVSAWVFLVEPHMARAVAICSADPFPVETPWNDAPSHPGPGSHHLPPPRPSLPPSTAQSRVL